MRRRFCALALSLSCLGAAGPVAADPSFDVIEPLPGNSHSQALGISETTLSRWRSQYGGMKAEEARRLKSLEEENKRLKKLLAEAELDKAILKEALEGN